MKLSRPVPWSPGAVQSGPPAGRALYSRGVRLPSARGLLPETPTVLGQTEEQAVRPVTGASSAVLWNAAQWGFIQH